MSKSSHSMYLGLSLSDTYSSSDTIKVSVDEDTVMVEAELHVEWLVNNQPR